MIIAPRNFRDEELLVTKKVLETSGGIVTIASTQLFQAQGMFGAKATPDTTIDKVDVDSFDGVIFVGGSGAEVYFNNATAHSIAKQAIQKNKILGAICIAPGILANAGVLNGRKATVWNGEYMNLLKRKGAIYTGEEVTKDQKIITANGPQAAEKFGKTIVEALSVI